MTPFTPQTDQSDAAAPPARSQARPQVLVVGGSGLVGRQCLTLLAQDTGVGSVRALLRRAVSPQTLLPPGVCQALPPGKLSLTVVDFDRLADQPDSLVADWVFCALGTTIRQAGSQAAFRRVDVDYPLAVARIARAQGARHFLLVSALGASARSRVFYSRVKGELEDEIRALGFESFTVARPSVLIGERSESRLGEALALKLGWLTPPAYKPVHARQVARALVAAAHAGQHGVRVLDNTILRRESAADTDLSS